MLLSLQAVDSAREPISKIEPTELFFPVFLWLQMTLGRTLAPKSDSGSERRGGPFFVDFEIRARRREHRGHLQKKKKEG